MVIDISSFTARRALDEFSALVFENAIDLRHAIRFKDRRYQASLLAKINHRLDEWCDVNELSSAQEEIVKELHDYQIREEYEEATGKSLWIYQRIKYGLNNFEITVDLPESIKEKLPGLDAVLEASAKKIEVRYKVANVLFYPFVKINAIMIGNKVESDLLFEGKLTRKEIELVMKVFDKKVSSCLIS